MTDIYCSNSHIYWIEFCLIDKFILSGLRSVNTLTKTTKTPLLHTHSIVWFLRSSRICACVCTRVTASVPSVFHQAPANPRAALSALDSCFPGPDSFFFSVCVCEYNRPHLISLSNVCICISHRVPPKKRSVMINLPSIPQGQGNWCRIIGHIGNRWQFVLSVSTWEIRCQCKCEIAAQCSQRFHENLNRNLKYFQQRDSSFFFFFFFLLPKLKWSLVKMIWTPESVRRRERHEVRRRRRMSVKSSCKILLHSFWQEVKFELKMCNYNIQDMYSYE